MGRDDPAPEHFEIYSEDCADETPVPDGSSGGRSLELWRCWHCAGDTFMANQSGWICGTCGADEFYNARHHQRHETRHGVWMYMPNQPSEDLTPPDVPGPPAIGRPTPATEDPPRLLVLKPVKLPNPRGPRRTPALTRTPCSLRHAGKGHVAEHEHAANLVLLMEMLEIVPHRYPKTHSLMTILDNHTKMPYSSWSRPSAASTSTRIRKAIRAALPPGTHAKDQRQVFDTVPACRRSLRSGLIDQMIFGASPAGSGRLRCGLCKSTTTSPSARPPSCSTRPSRARRRNSWRRPPWSGSTTRMESTTSSASSSPTSTPSSSTRSASYWATLRASSGSPLSQSEDTSTGMRERSRSFLP